MSIFFLSFLLILLYLVWIIYGQIDKTNTTKKLKISKIDNENKKFDYQKTVYVINKQKEQKTRLIFGRNNSKKRMKIVFFGLGTFIIGLYNFTNLFNYEIIIYNGIFKIIYLLIMIISLLIIFLIARDTFLNNKNKLLFFRLFEFIVSFVIGGIFFAFYVNIVLISGLNRLVISSPKTEIINKFEVISKETYDNHGKHYRIITKGLDNMDFSFNVSKKKFDQIHKGEKIKIKYYVTNNKTIYIINGENPFE